MTAVPVRDLSDRVRRLVSLAASTGADAAWLKETADVLVAAVLEAEAHRRGDCDPRRRAALARARRAAKRAAAMAKVGHDRAAAVEALRASYGVSRATAYRWLAAVASHES